MAKQSSSSWKFPSWAEPSWKGSELSQFELGYFNFWAETKLTNFKSDNWYFWSWILYYFKPILLNYLIIKTKSKFLLVFGRFSISSWMAENPSARLELITGSSQKWALFVQHEIRCVVGFLFGQSPNSTLHTLDHFL